MDRILIILKKKENGPRASSSPALGLNTIIFKHVYWYMQQISGERLQDHWSSGLRHSRTAQFAISNGFLPNFELTRETQSPTLQTKFNVKIKLGRKYS